MDMEEQKTKDERKTPPFDRDGIVSLSNGRLIE